MKDIDNRIDMLKNQIEDLKSRLPAHSVKPAMLIELEELEEELDRLVQTRDKNGRQSDGGKSDEGSES